VNFRTGGVWLAALLATAGCRLPPIKSEGTVKAEQLPGDVAALIKYADDIYVKANATVDGGSGTMEDALTALEKARTLDPKSFEAAWKAARVCVWLADETYDDKNKRANFSGRGIDHAKAAIALEPKRVEGHYYSGMNLGLQATTKLVGAKFMVPSVRDAEKKAQQIDASYDKGGPPRVLGSLYAEAPPWPASIGDPDKGVQLLQEALSHGKDYPLNMLLLGNALVKAEKPDEARGLYRAVLAAQPNPDDTHFLVKWKQKAQKAIEDLDKKPVS